MQRRRPPDVPVCDGTRARGPAVRTGTVTADRMITPYRHPVP
ncbi:hypothetical protein ATKI12_1855 [Kitasatospora sp. Ki12]